MRGIVLSYDRKQKKGLISGDDGIRYTFLIDDFETHKLPQKGLKIDFEITNGMIAKSIILIPEKRKKVPILRLIVWLLLLGFLYPILNETMYDINNGSPAVRDANKQIEETYPLNKR
jgi:hypothetical protein